MVTEEIYHLLKRKGMALMFDICILIYVIHNFFFLFKYQQLCPYSPGKKNM